MGNFSDRRHTPEPQRRRVVELRRASRRGAGFIAHRLAMNASTDFFTLINAANASPEKPLNIGEFEEAWPPI